MSVIQAILISLVYFLAVSTLSGGVGFFTFYRPLVAGFCVGLILGDPVAGTTIGAAINLLYIGNVSTGGTLPSDTTLAAIIGTTLGITSGIDVNSALAVAVPVGLLGTLLWVGRLSIDSIFIPLAKKMAMNGDADKIWIPNVLLPQLLLFLISAVPCFIIEYWGVEYVGDVLNYLGQNVLSILNIIGGILPALGLGLTLKALFKDNTKIYFFLGFILMQYFKLDTISIGYIALIIAVIIYKQSEGKTEVSNEVVEENIQKRSGLITKRDLIRSSLIWQTQAQGCYNYENMQGIGFMHSMVPIFKKLYKDDKKGMSEALLRHSGFFNVAVQFAAVIPGLVAAMEEEKALNAEGIDESSIIAIKTSLMGPLSGIGDTILQGVLVPLLLSFFIGISMDGNILGPILYTIIITVLVFALNYFSYMFGYKKGGNAILRFLESGKLNKIINSATVMGCIVIGGLVAKYVTFKVGVNIPLNDGVFNLQEELFDKILPGMLPLLLTLGCYKLIDKGISTIKVMIILVFIGAAGGLLGILA